MLKEAHNIAAWIEVSDDEGLTWSVLYDYREEHDLTSSTCYIEVKEGQYFRYRVRDYKPVAQITSTSVDYYFDGVNARKKVHGPATLKNGAMCRRVHSGSGGVRAFVFQKLRTTSDERSASDIKTSKALGKLEIELWRFDIEGARAANPPIFDDESRVFLEQRVKMQSEYQVGLGPASPSKAPCRLVSGKRLDSSPYITFTFKYMSAALLDFRGLRGFMAEEARPLAAGENNDGGDASEPAAPPVQDNAELVDEVKRLREEVELLRRKRVKREPSVKQEANQENLDDDIEEKKPKIKPAMLTAGLTIDLTEE